MRGRRTTSILAVLGFAAVAAGALTVSPAAARSPVERVTLGGVNTISGDHIAGMPVRVPRPAWIEGDPFSNDDVSYSGKGRVVGLVLVEEDVPLRKAYDLVSVRWSFCGAPGCRPDRGDVTELTSSPDFGDKRWRIPAGDYRLYLVADGAPVDVTLRLNGLDGSTHLRPSDRVAGRVAAPTAFVPDPAGHLFLGRAPAMRMPAPGLLIDGDSTGFRLGPSVTASGNCFWRGRNEDAFHATPGPHCMEFAERAGYGGGVTVLGGGGASWGLGTVPAGIWQSSYWAANVTPFPDSEFVTLWVSYEGRT